MANAKSERKTLSYEFDGSMLLISDADTTLRRFDFDEIPTSLTAQFLQLGRKTKLANFAASAKTEGRDRLDMIDEGWQQLLAGKWEAERSGGGPTVSAEVEALAQIKGASVASIQKALRGYSEEARKTILSHPKVIELAAHLKAKRETTETFLGDMLDEMADED